MPVICETSTARKLASFKTNPGSSKTENKNRGVFTLSSGKGWYDLSSERHFRGYHASPCC